MVASVHHERKYRSSRLVGVARWRLVCIMRGLGEDGEALKMRMDVRKEERRYTTIVMILM